MAAGLTAGLLLAPGASQAAQVIATDLIVQGSACVGFDCNSGESFGFDTLRLKENNLRINFNDTSSSASFPSNDWRIVANDTSNGGANYLGIEDSNTGRMPFRVEAGARANALYVEGDGHIGIGTANPVVNLHVVEGNTPTLRLEQDGSSGFTAQTWDLAGNEANFFIRDATNSSNLPFRIKPGSGNDDAIVIAADGDVGIGTDNPSAGLHVRDTGADVNQTMLRLDGDMANNVPHLQIQSPDPAGRTEIWLADSTPGDELRLQRNGDDFNISFNGTGGAELTVNKNTRNVSIPGGNLTVAGTISSGGTTLNVPDYVFAPEYDLMPLHEVESFITANRHLPRIPSADEVKANGLNMTEMQMALLEKVEELTLYTLEQQRTIDALKARLDMD